jgi:hypothetical protein
MRSGTTAFGSPVSAMALGKTPYADSELSGRLAFDNPKITEYAVVAIRSTVFSGTWPTDGYLLEIEVNSNQFTVRRGVAGAYVTLNTTAKTLTAGTAIWFRFQAIGSSIRAKVWNDGTNEPSAWDATVVNTDITAAGYAGVSWQNGVASVATALFDNIAFTNFVNPDYGWPFRENQPRRALPHSNRAPFAPVPPVTVAAPTAPAYPPAFVAPSRRASLAARRGRFFPAPALAALVAPAFIASSWRTAPARRGRPFQAVSGQTARVAPNSRQTRRPAVLSISNGRFFAPPVAASTEPRTPRITSRRPPALPQRGGSIYGPIREQINPPYPFELVRVERRRLAQPRRGRFIEPYWPPQAPVSNPDIVFAFERMRIRYNFVPRRGSVQVVPSASSTPVAPARAPDRVASRRSSSIESRRRRFFAPTQQAASIPRFRRADRPGVATRRGRYQTLPVAPPSAPVGPRAARRRPPGTPPRRGRIFPVGPPPAAPQVGIWRPPFQTSRRSIRPCAVRSTAPAFILVAFPLPAVVPPVPPTPAPSSNVGGWAGLVSIVREAQEIAEFERYRAPVACPKCGQPLIAGVNTAVLHCSFDGWSSGGDPRTVRPLGDPLTQSDDDLIDGPEWDGWGPA